MYSQEPTGTLAVDLFGLEPSEDHDQLLAESASLSGLLSITSGPGVSTPAYGERQNVMLTANGITSCGNGNSALAEFFVRRIADSTVVLAARRKRKPWIAFSLNALRSATTKESGHRPQRLPRRVSGLGSVSDLSGSI